MWVAEQNHVHGQSWPSLRRLAAHLYVTQTAFWGTARDRTGPGVRNFLRSRGCLGVFKVRRVYNDDGSYSDLVKLDEEALLAAAAAARGGAPSSSRPQPARASCDHVGDLDNGSDIDHDLGDDDIDDDVGDKRECCDVLLLGRVRELAEAVWPLSFMDPALSVAHAIRRVAAARLVQEAALSRRRACAVRALGQHVLHYLEGESRGESAEAAAARRSNWAAALYNAASVFRFCHDAAGDEAVYMRLKALKAAAGCGADARNDALTAAAAARQERSDGAQGLGRSSRAAVASKQQQGGDGAGDAFTKLDWQMLEAAAARVCDSSLRGRVWRLLAAVLAPVSKGPFGPRSMKWPDLHLEVQLRYPDLFEEAVAYCDGGGGGKDWIRDLVLWPSAAGGGASGSCPFIRFTWTETHGEVVVLDTMVLLRRAASAAGEGGADGGAAGAAPAPANGAPATGDGAPAPPASASGRSLSDAPRARSAAERDVWVSPLERELFRRFPSAPPAVAMAAAAEADPLQQDAEAIAAAKRCIVRLLVAAPPPHQLDFQQLGAELPRALGGVKPVRRLWVLCSEEPSVLQVVPQGERHHAVRLVCPTFLALAEEGGGEGRRGGGASQRHYHNHQQPQEQEQQQQAARREPASAAAVSAAVDAALRGGSGGGRATDGGPTGWRAPGAAVSSARRSADGAAPPLARAVSRAAAKLIPAATMRAAVRTVPSDAVSETDDESPLEHALLARFPPPPGVSEEMLRSGIAAAVAAGDGADARGIDGDDWRSAARARTALQSAAIAAAKCSVARLLAQAPPPHQIPMAQLGTLVSKALGRGLSQLTGQPLRQVVSREAEVFELLPLVSSHVMVRLICPKLLALARQPVDSTAVAASNSTTTWRPATAPDAPLSLSVSTSSHQQKQRQSGSQMMITSGASAANAAAIAAAAATAAAASAAVKAALARAAQASALGITSSRQLQQAPSHSYPQQQQQRQQGPAGAGSSSGSASGSGSDGGGGGDRGGGAASASQWGVGREALTAAGASRTDDQLALATGPVSSTSRSGQRAAPGRSDDAVRAPALPIAAAPAAAAAMAETAGAAAASLRARIPIPVPVPIPIPDSDGHEGTELAEETEDAGGPLLPAPPTPGQQTANSGRWALVSDAGGTTAGAAAAAPASGATAGTAATVTSAASDLGASHTGRRSQTAMDGVWGALQAAARSHALHRGGAAPRSASAAEAFAVAGSASPETANAGASAEADAAGVTAAAVDISSSVAAAAAAVSEGRTNDNSSHEYALQLHTDSPCSAEQRQASVSGRCALRPQPRSAFETALCARICPDPRLRGASAQRAAAATAALCCAARLLAARPPPHELPLAVLEEVTASSVPAAAQGEYSLAGALAQEPRVFEVREDGGDGSQFVRLICPTLLRLSEDWRVWTRPEAPQPLQPPPQELAEQPPQQQRKEEGGGSPVRSYGVPEGMATVASETEAEAEAMHPESESEGPTLAMPVPVSVPLLMPMPAQPSIPVPVPVPVVLAVEAEVDELAAGGVAVAAPSSVQQLHGVAPDNIDGRGAPHQPISTLPPEQLLPPPPSPPRPQLPMQVQQPYQYPAHDIEQYYQQLKHQQRQPLDFGQPLPRYNGASGAAAAAETPGMQQQLLPAPSPESAVAPPLPDTEIYIVHDPHSAEYGMMIEHCYSSSQLGLAVHYSAGVPALVAVYAPPLAFVGADGQYLGRSYDFPAAVYLVDCTAGAAAAGIDGAAGAAAVEQEAALVGVVVENLRGFLEDPNVQKVVYGCERTVDALEAAIGATVSSVLDVRLLLDSLVSMLPSLHPPPSAEAVVATAAADDGSGGSLLAPAGAAAIEQLQVHTAALRDSLAGTGLWADRPELLGALAGRHAAALQEELWAATGRDRCWLSRPLSEVQVALAGAAARHLPELWAALAVEAVPWVAAAAAAGRLARLRAARQPAVLAAPLHY